LCKKCAKTHLRPSEIGKNFPGVISPDPRAEGRGEGREKREDRGGKGEEREGKEGEGRGGEGLQPLKKWLSVLAPGMGAIMLHQTARQLNISSSVICPRSLSAEREAAY
jgi:hypothetical protein